MNQTFRLREEVASGSELETRVLLCISPRLLRESLSYLVGATQGLQLVGELCDPGSLWDAALRTGPDVIVLPFEGGPEVPPIGRSLFRGFPHTLLVGLSVERHYGLVWLNGRLVVRLEEPTPDTLLEAIRGVWCVPVPTFL